MDARDGRDGGRDGRAMEGGEGKNHEVDSAGRVLQWLISLLRALMARYVKGGGMGMRRVGEVKSGTAVWGDEEIVGSGG